MVNLATLKYFIVSLNYAKRISHVDVKWENFATTLPNDGKLLNGFCYVHIISMQLLK